MTLQVRFTTEATAELEDAAHWYEQRHEGLGLAFLAAVDRAVDSAAEWPRTGALIEGIATDIEARRVPVARSRTTSRTWSAMKSSTFSP